LTICQCIAHVNVAVANVDWSSQHIDFGNVEFFKFECFLKKAYSSTRFPPASFQFGHRLKKKHIPIPTRLLWGCCWRRAGRRAKKNEF
jgi:hypothetical protein